MKVKIENINAEMARQNFSIAKMAKELSLSYQGFYHKIKGNRKFTADEIINLARILKVDVNIFFN